MKFLKYSLIIILTVTFGSLWIMSFYQFAKNPTRQPKQLNNEKEMAPESPPVITSS
jgi:uncharacterized alpha/beta hydrolase family protein